jgi:hypothetical protein
VLKASITPSFDAAVIAAAAEIRRRGRDHEIAYRLEIGAAYERICDEPIIGRSLGGAMRSHRLVHFPFAIIYEVTDDEIVFLYLASRR